MILKLLFPRVLHIQVLNPYAANGCIMNQLVLGYGWRIDVWNGMDGRKG